MPLVAVKGGRWRAAGAPAPAPSPAPAGGLPVDFTLTSSSGGSNLPWTFGHAFAEGDWPVASGLTADVGEIQATPTSYWPDGSVKHAIIAGRTTLSAGVATPIELSLGTPTGGADLTTTDLAAALPTTTIAVSGALTHTLTLGSIVASPHREVCVGPVMSNWLYRQPVTGSSHLVLWVDVRLYKGGTVEIFPWVENGYLTVASPATITGCTFVVTIGGSEKFNQAFSVAHHTRIPLVSGTSFSHWSSDPGITPTHDTAYLQATKLVPNYGFGVPAEASTSFTTSYTPNTLAGVSSAMGSAGNTASLLRTEQAYYIASGGVLDGYRAMMVFGLSSGSWSCHYRDDGGLGHSGPNEPFVFGDYPNASINVQDSPVIPTGTGTTNGEWIASHLPTYGYLPWLCTGRWWFLEEQLFWTTALYLSASTSQRAGSGTGSSATPEDFIVDPRRGSWAHRGAHWALRTLAQTLAILPSDHPCYAAHVNAWQKNTEFYEACFVTGSLQSGTWISPMGWLGEFSEDGTSLYSSRVAGNGKDPGDQWWGAAWMAGYGVQVWGHAWDLGLPQSSGSLVSHEAVRDQAYKQVVERAADGSGGSWNWRRFAVYEVPIGTDDTGVPVDDWYTSSEAYAAFCAAYELATSPSGNYLTERYSDDELLDNFGSDIHYMGISVAGLAYAVDHGIAGAQAGWDRITAASNWGTVKEYLDIEFAIAPRAGG